MTDLEKQVARLRTLARLNQLVSSSLDIDRILGGIAGAAVELTDARIVSVWVADEAAQTLELHAFSDEAMGVNHPRRSMRFGEGGAGWVAAHRRPLAVPDLWSDDRVFAKSWFRERGLRSAYAVPIICQGSLLGVLALLGHEPFDFGAEDQDLLDSFVAQAAIAIRNARLFAESETRRGTAEALVEVGQLLSQTLDPDLVARRVAESVCRLLDARSSAVYRLEPGSRALVLQAVSSSVGWTFHWTATLAPGTGLAGLALRERSPVASPDVLDDPRIAYTPDARARIADATHRAALVVPLLVQDAEFGAIAVGDRTGRVFTREEMQVVQAFASQAALALENARLFEETERRRREAELVAGLAQQINASLDLDTIMARVSEAARDLCGADLAWIALSERDSGAMVLRYGPGARGSGYDGLRIEPGKGMGGQVLLTGHPFRTDDYAGDPRITRDYLGIADREGVVTALVVPIQTDGRIEGLLYAENRSPRPFTARDEAILVWLAEHAGIAIRNARLLEDLKSRQVRLEALLDASHELSQIQPVQSLLETIARACGQVLDSDSVGFRVVEGDELVIAGGSGDAREVMSTPRLKIGKSVSGIVAATGAPLLVEDASEDARVIPEHREHLRRLGYRAWLGVPVKIGERVVGVLSIRTRHKGGFSKEDQAIAAAFASQAATALENARLFQEVQQAYTEVSRVQDELMQAQKMDAIGRLAGGMAHDFNNLLTIVHGRSEILLRRLGADPKSRYDVEVIQGTAVRAAALTRQLLAFSRKQVLQPKVLSLNNAVTDSAAMFRRLIGEDINLVVVPGAGLDRVKVDPTQLEQILINLAVNARDAMPRGGRFVIETANVELGDSFVSRHPGSRTGPHVMLSVCDSGVGMSPEVQAHIFEPFFTTKETGKGTGLGLATVYGIVKQHGGYIELKSASGEGTIFSIYLPRVEEAEEMPATQRAAGEAPRGSETILLVEDEDEVRELAREILEMNGYTVIDAASGAEALRVCRQHQDRVHLLLTDVVMPGMSGRELARQVGMLRPDTKVVYMSGYTDDALGHHGVLEPGIILLEKPFTPESLLRAVRSALDAPHA